MDAPLESDRVRPLYKSHSIDTINDFKFEFWTSPDVYPTPESRPHTVTVSDSSSRFLVFPRFQAEFGHLALGPSNP